MPVIKTNLHSNKFVSRVVSVIHSPGNRDCICGPHLSKISSHKLSCFSGLRDHPFKTSAFFRGKGSKIMKICRRLKWMVPYQWVRQL